MTTVASTALALTDLVLVDAYCRCPNPHRPALRFLASAMLDIRAALADRPSPDRVVGTWRCDQCRTVVPITAADLLLAST